MTQGSRGTTRQVIWRQHGLPVSARSCLLNPVSSGFGAALQGSWGLGRSRELLPRVQMTQGWACVTAIEGSPHGPGRQLPALTSSGAYSPAVWECQVRFDTLFLSVLRVL